MAEDSTSWYSVIEGPDLHQGDIIQSCPVIDGIKGEGLEEDNVELPNLSEDISITLRRANVIVISNSCDLIQDKIKTVILCPIWSIGRYVYSVNKSLKEAATSAAKKIGVGFPIIGSSDFEEKMREILFSEESTSEPIRKHLEGIRRGHMPAYYMLNECGETGQPCMIVDFHRVYAHSKDLVKKIAEKRGKRLRLKLPYNDALTQAFGKYFMRIGYPTEIAKFHT